MYFSDRGHENVFLATFLLRSHGPEGLRLRNKFRCAHIRRAKQKMNVDLTAQTISARVTDAIEFCDHVFKIPAFYDSAPTVKFVIMPDHLFDVFN